VPKIVGSPQLQVREVGAGTMESALVETAKAVARQGRPYARGHAVAAAGASEDQGRWVGAGWQLATDRVDHQWGQRKLADGGIALGTGLEATTELAGLIRGVDHLYHGHRAVKVDAMGAQAGELAKA
jgi:hypothetical protein